MRLEVRDNCALSIFRVGLASSKRDVTCTDANPSAQPPSFAQQSCKEPYPHSLILYTLFAESYCGISHPSRNAIDLGVRLINSAQTPLKTRINGG